VPLPLLFGAMPVVSDGFLDAEVAAGRGVPGPPGLLWAYASELDRIKEVARNAANVFIGSSFNREVEGKLRRRPYVPTVAKADLPTDGTSD
jgi:hypothetical protein